MRGVHAQDIAPAGESATADTEQGETTKRWKRSSGTPPAQGHRRLIGSACETATTVWPAWAAAMRATVPRWGGHAAKELAAGEGEAARPACTVFHAGSFERAASSFRSTRQVALEQPRSWSPAQSERLADRLRRLLRPFEREA